MNKKYLFFDIDGTLTDDRTHRIVPSALRALQLLRENGHFTAIATGRAHYKTAAFAKKAGFDNIVCCGGGALVLNGRLIENTPLDQEKALSVIRHADAASLGWVIMKDDSDKVFFRDLRFLEKAGLRKELTTYVYDPDLDPAAAPILKIYLSIRAEEEDKYPWINELGHLRLSENYIVFQYDAKRDGILRMMRLIGGDPKDVVVFGDDMNDLVMFDPQWTSIAMGNGKDALKEKADYVTDCNVNDGIQKACLHFGWIREEQLIKKD